VRGRGRIEAPSVAGEIATRVDVEPTIFAFDDLAVGQRALLTREVVAADRGLDGAAAPFGQAIGVGAFTLGLVAEVLGTRLPGPGAVYLSQTSQFLAPVQAGDIVEASVEVVELVPARGRARLFFECACDGRPVLEGEAWVALERRPRA
jgi:3-hydroxybutyryl-CoA dehydratase